jgi:hypothetical protein
MPNANEPQTTANVTINLFGGLVSDPDPADLPSGVSPANQDCAFLQGSVLTRPGLSSLLAPTPTPMVFAETYNLPDGTPTTVLVGSNGNLYQQPNVASTAITSISAGTSTFVPPGSLITSTVADTRLYLASFNQILPGGASAPAIWDGTNLTRLTQDGPAEPLVISEQSLNLNITSISQPAALGVLPLTAAITMSTTTINFFQNTTGVYTGLGTQTNGTPYINGTSLAFNSFLPNFPISGIGNMENQSPVCQLQQNSSGNYVGSTYFPETARISIDGFGFDANIQTTLHVTTAGTYTFYSLLDDGYAIMMGSAITGGGTVTYISGPRVGTEPSSKAGNAYICGRNVRADPGRTWETTVINFSAPGNFPLEIGWSNWSDGGKTCYVEMSWVPGTGPTAGGRSPVGNPFLPTPSAGSCTCTESGSTVTVSCPSAHPFGVGDTALIGNMSIDSYNGLQIVTSVPNSTSFTFTATLTGLAVGLGGTVSPICATCTTSTPHGLLVDDGVVVAGNSEVKYNNNNNDTLAVVINPGQWIVSAILDDYNFQFNALENAGDVGSGGILSCGGMSAPGIHKACVFYEYEDGSLSAPSPLTQFNSSGNTKVTVWNLPLGTPNTVARCVAFSASGGSNFFYLPTDIIGTQSTLGGVSMPALIGTSTRVPDNTTLNVTFDFSDASLLAATAIDIPGNNLFSQVTIAPCQGVIEYADRLFVYNEYNKVQNLLGMSLSAGYSPATPPGWDGNGDASGAQTLGNLQTYRWTVTGDGTSDGKGFLQQGAYQDALNVPILLPQTKYRWRAFLQPSATTGTGLMTVDLYSIAGGPMASASVDLTTVSSAGAWCEARMTVATPHTIPTDSILRVFATGIAASTTCSISDLQLIPDLQPVVTTQLRGSYAFNRNAFDGVTGKLQIPGNLPITDCFVYKDTLFIATAKSLYSTEDSGSEPSGWAIKEVSNRVGVISPRASDGSDSSYFMANRSGVYLTTGDDPDNISTEIKRSWDTVNWAYPKLIWLVHDPVERVLYVGAPINGSTTVNAIFMCSFRSCQKVDVPNPIHVSISGKIEAIEDARKWSIWTIPAAFGSILTNATDDKMAFGVVGKNQVYTLSSTHLHDDDTSIPIPAYYTTYFFLGSADEQQLQLGSHRHLLQYVTASAQGTGNLLISPFVDDLSNPRRPLKQKPLVPGTVFHDIELPANCLGERIALMISAVPAAGSLDAHFAVRKLTVSLQADLLTPIGGRQ